jgi:hypothetical protein
MGDLSFENILGEQEIETLFMEPEDASTEEEVEDSAEASDVNADNENGETKETTEVVNPEDLFEDEVTRQPESVGSEKNSEEKGGAATGEGSDTSPKNFYSSIANALAVDGIFPNLDEETIGKVTDAETLSDAIEAEINARLDEKQKRISDALENGVEPDSIRQYEGTLDFLSKVTDSQLTDESESGEQLRQRLIYQDFINKGYKPQKAQQLTQRSIDNGNDVEDAKEALQSNREYFQEQYDDLLKQAQKDAEKAKQERVKQEEKLKKSLLEDKDLMGDMEISKDIRKKVFDNISRPIYKDPETGQYLTAIQKFETEHPGEFLKFAGLFFTLTDGFKDFKSFAKAEVRKEMKKGLRELEQTLQNTRRSSDGSLNLVGSRKSDPESFLEGGFKLAL